MADKPDGTASKGAPPPQPDFVPAMTGVELVLRKEEAGAFLFDPLTCRLSCLNDVGVMVYEMIDGRRTVAEIAAEVSARFEGAPEGAVGGDVASFLADLMNLGYVKAADGGAA